LNIDSAQHGYYPDIVVVASTPYASWFENNGANDQVHVKRCISNTWEYCGNMNLDVNRNGAWPSMAVFNSTPYIAWQEHNGTAYQINYRYYNGSNWQYGESLNIDPNMTAYSPSLASSGSFLVATWRENQSSREQVVAKYFNGVSWTQLGGSLNIDINQNVDTSWPKIDISNNNAVYVAWGETDGSNIHLYTKKYALPTPTFTSTPTPTHTPTPLANIISFIKPTSSLPDRQINVSLLGYPFSIPATIKLQHSGVSDINATNVNVMSSRKITGSLSLNGAIPGYYNIQINSGSGIAMLENEFLVLDEIIPPIQWQVTDLGQAGVSTSTDSWRGIFIGDGDGDKLPEVFSAGLLQRLLKYDINNSAWVVSPLPAGPIGELYTSVIVCDGDSDGAKEVYGATLDNKVYEYSSPNWNKVNLCGVGDLGSEVYALAYGDGNNDDIIEVYAACETGEIYEFKYAMSWSNTIVGYGTGAMNAVAVGDGNNDGVMEVYGASQDKNIYQFVFNGSSWNKTIIGTGWDEFTSLEMGDGDQDNDIEIYGSNADGKIYQFSWNVFHWEVEIVDNQAITGIVIGDADVNGTNEVYCSSLDGNIYQYQKTAGQWVKSVIGASPSGLSALAIGDGDNDYKLEIYAVSQDSHVYEFKAGTIPTPTMTPIPDFDGKIISKKHIYAAPNPIRGHIANIVIHTQQAAVVSGKLFTTHNREVLSFNRQYYTGKHIEKINVSNLANGVYLLLVTAKAMDGTEERVIKKIALVK
jgi:hypothetical protein